MQLAFKIKHYLFNAFRELFVYNHSSLEFRAKLFALILSANENAKIDDYSIIKKIGMKIYKNDEERADLLVLNTKELIEKVKENNGLDIDTLVLNIQKDLKLMPRYAKKIDIDSLKELLNLSHDGDVISYQENMIEFLQTLKVETLHEKRVQIAKDEENIESKY
ncbi:hypothetical protein CVO_03010 [Sulfurimonas sp. CVO]|jgi:hypothetical protein|uniref:Uncharacterized protein n=1 Tax=Sulfurimonas xiamenensis TaxID=2590021 RepID=A0AAJ4DMV2_9BACT|nr:MULTISPECIES: hypothetical protein [Sulfurimonas]PLY13308.1 MAG: hypothetical protein C0628_06820 [Sulfurimonas sp.]QFR43568.1 hypothetical protein FJR47_06455 [Sulfurimonas xiamenensis]QHG90870.1 hypothetical protein CVO_03010 [Sulfurimonas sp. CVO]